MKCKCCGEEIADDSKFYEFCGKKTGQKEYTTKHVDVRWCLLPAMILSTCLVYMFHYHSIPYRQGYFEHGLVWLIPVVILFGLSVYYGLKKAIQPSLILVMTLLFAGNLAMFVISDNNPSECYRIYTRITFSDTEDEQNNDWFELFYLTFNNDFQETDRQAEIVCDALKEKGYIINDKNTATDTEYYASGSFDIAWCVIVLLLLYLIYAFVAHKKNLKF